MAGVREHIHHAGGCETKPQHMHQVFGIARQCRRIARDIHDAFHAFVRQTLDSFHGAVARRVEQQFIEAEAIPRCLGRGVIIKIGLAEFGVAKTVAFGIAPRAGDQLRIGLDAEHLLCVTRQRQREVSQSAKQVEYPVRGLERRATSVPDAPDVG